MDVSGEDLLEHIDRFEDSKLDATILDNVSRAKFSKPTPIQKYAIPYGIEHRFGSSKNNKKKEMH